MSAEVNSETRKRAHTWCTQSIGGVWRKVREGELIVKELSGGLSNKLYTCSLSEEIEVVYARDNVPRKVLMREYGEITRKEDCMLRNTVVYALFAEKNLGPKLYGMYPDGRVEEFINARPLMTAELSNQRFSTIIAKKLAYIHTLDMPLCKSPTFFEDQLESWLVDAEKILTGEIGLNNPELPQDIKRQISDIAMKFEMSKLWEMQRYLSGTLQAVQSPVVFSHNDLQEGNILLKETETDEDKQLTVIDLEYCSYNYRGFDFGNHFCEWTLNYGASHHTYTPGDFPSRERQDKFFKDYLKEKRRLEGDSSPITEEELSALYKEASIFAMFSHFIWGVWSIVQLKTADIKFDYSDYACARLAAVKEQRQKLIKEGLLPNTAT